MELRLKQTKNSDKECGKYNFGQPFQNAEQAVRNFLL
jgi:hypothetical protein